MQTQRSGVILGLKNISKWNKAIVGEQLALWLARSTTSGQVGRWPLFEEK